MDSTINFSEIEIFDDGISELEILRLMVDKRKSEEPFHMLNVGDILMKHRVWLQKFPRIVPYYAVKCNPNPTVIKVLAVLGVNFDCASKGEICQVMRQGVSSDRIIFANPVKFSSHIEYAKNVGVSMMVVDTEDEVKRIKFIYPKAKIIIRIRCDSQMTPCALGEKYGCDSEESAVKLIHCLLAHGMELCGFSFHAGSPCNEPSAICRGINSCKRLIDTARSIGCTNANIIDIGGGIPGTPGFNVDEVNRILAEREVVKVLHFFTLDINPFQNQVRSTEINAALENVDPSIAIIAEPGRYFVASASIAAACILNKRIVMKGVEKRFMYYVTDGTNGSFRGEAFKLYKRHPIVLYPKHPKNNVRYISTIWGPTCASLDFILKETVLPELEIGDWLAWFNLGEYSISVSTRFNGFLPPKEYPVMKKADWILMRQVVKDKALANEKLVN